MDKLIYTAMSGAKATMGQQQSVANNLANSATNGFRAELHRFRAVNVQSPALPTRAFVVDASIAADFRPGPLMKTDSPYDVAISGPGMFAVQGLDGAEAYTRNGSFNVDSEGVLRTNTGLQVLGDSGPVDWREMQQNASVRSLIAKAIPGLEAMEHVDRDRGGGDRDREP